MIQWRLYTERKNERQVIAEIAKHFRCATVTYSNGIWQGIPENSMVIEILGVPMDEQEIVSLANWIKGYNQQEAVTITVTDLLHYTTF